jgi:hypothetical protein
VDRILTNTPLPTLRLVCKKPRINTLWVFNCGVKFSIDVHLRDVTNSLLIKGVSPKLSVSAPTPDNLSALAFSRAARSALFASCFAALAAFSAAFFARFSLFLSDASVTEPSFLIFFSFGGGP